MVYVDDGCYKYRGMKMCHMIADTLEELHSMAIDLGLKIEWFQDKKIKHYDICLAKKKQALTKGAIQITKKELVKKGLLLENN